MELGDNAPTFLLEVADKTAGKKLKWQATAEEGVFVTSLGGKYTVKMFPFSKIDQIGRRVGEASLTLYEENEILLDVTEESKGISQEALTGLYATVSRQVYRVDEKHESIQDAIARLKNL
jgi:hypothetical protein